MSAQEKRNINDPNDGHPVQALELAYRKIKELYEDVDSYDVAKEVDLYRNYWRPKKTNVILLAESHVFTSDEDLKIRIDYSGYEHLIPNYPKGYVRFVYCFGYAEHGLLKNSPLERKLKVGTPQFWKIFSLCIPENEISNFELIKKSATKTDERIKNKITLLIKLREKGIWLLDASIVGLYNKGKKPPHKIMKEIIHVSWDNYVRELIAWAKPRYIMCVGKFVRDILEGRIAKTNIPFDYMHQPQAHLTSEQRAREYEKLRTICSEYCPPMRT